MAEQVFGPKRGGVSMTDLHEVAIEVAKEKLAKVSRLEVIDETGRGYVRYFKQGERLTYQFQDDDRTLKIFVDKHGMGDLKFTTAGDFIESQQEYYYPGSDPQE